MNSKMKVTAKMKCTVVTCADVFLPMILPKILWGLEHEGAYAVRRQTPPQAVPLRVPLRIAIHRRLDLGRSSLTSSTC